MVVVSETEKKYLTYVIIVAVIWSVIITTFSQQLQALDVWIQFIAITLVEYALPSIVLSFYLNGGEKLDYRKMFGAFAFFMSFDLIFPPLLLDLGGVVHTEGIVFGRASIDAVIAGAWGSLGITGLPLFLLTYPITFLLLQCVVVYALTGRQLWSMVKI